MARIVERRLRRGLAAVEAALVMPLLLLLVLGLLQFGWIFLRTQHITHAARHGARIAATADADYQKVNAAIDSWMTQVGLQGKYTWWPEPADFTALDTGEMVTVFVMVNKSDLQLFGESTPADPGQPPLIPAGPDGFTAKVTMAKEGP